MQKGNVDSAMKLITNNMQKGILPLTDTTLTLLKQKRPNSVLTTEEVFLSEQPESIQQIKYENINADAVCKPALKAKGDSRPSGIDANGWKKILTSKQLFENSTDLCTSMANMIKKLCIKKAFLSCRLIPLDRNIRLRPIGVGEMLRRIITSSHHHIGWAVTTMRRTKV